MEEVNHFIKKSDLIGIVSNPDIFEFNILNDRSDCEMYDGILTQDAVSCIGVNGGGEIEIIVSTQYEIIEDDLNFLKIRAIQQLDHNNQPCLHKIYADNESNVQVVGESSEDIIFDHFCLPNDYINKSLIEALNFYQMSCKTPSFMGVI
jgi:Zn-dependent M16 (insulinase) family peptidase